LVPMRAETRTPMLRAMNLVTRLPGGVAAVGGLARSGRNLFMVPWRGRAVFGTWESGQVCAADALMPPAVEIDAFIREIAAAFPGFRLERDDVTLVHRGVVPAIADAHGGVRLEGHQVVRDHASEASRLEGLISVAGTKYTTARAVAEEITNRVIGKLGRDPIPCRTATTPLLKTVQSGSPVSSAAAHSGASVLPADVKAHLTAAYGPAQTSIVALTQTHPSLADRVAEKMPVIGAELIWAVRQEMAMTLADAVVRRTPLGALGYPGEAAAARAAAIIGAELRWDDGRREAELHALRAFYRLL
jgi:glycerol-3-phosphate dehydrogenase